MDDPRKIAEWAKMHEAPDSCPVCHGRYERKPKHSRDVGPYGYRYSCGYGVWKGEVLGGCRFAGQVVADLREMKMHAREMKSDAEEMMADAKHKLRRMGDCHKRLAEFHAKFRELGLEEGLDMENIPRTKWKEVSKRERKLEATVKRWRLKYMELAKKHPRTPEDRKKMPCPYPPEEPPCTSL